MEKVTHIVINIAGDSGDGIQLTGSQFSLNTALKGNALATFPNFPAEIRAPQGTVAGVSGFQIHFSSEKVYTPGDYCDVLIVMNAAALKAQLYSLKRGGLIIANTSGFTSNNLRLAKCETNPLDDGSLSDYQVIAIDISKLTKEATDGIAISTKERERAKNMFVLGMLYWMYDRDMQSTLDEIKQKFKGNDILMQSNVKTLQAGYYFADTCELFQSGQVRIEKAKLSQGKYRSITGNHALSVGLITAAERSGLKLFYGTYPITPASDILHELSLHKNFGVITFQAEDEIAAIGSAIGASYGGNLGVTGTSGPGMALKAEAIGLMVMLELPLVICNIQRGGPSTGLPTKTEQSDLMQAFYGRNGESPLPIVAASTPADCFYMAIEAVRIAVEHMTPVILLSDGYLANGSEIWKFPKAEDIQAITPPFKKQIKEQETLLPYERDGDYVRPWIVPGTSQMMHRIGGLEKQQRTGNVSYDPLNHQAMILERQRKIDAISASIPRQKIDTGAEQGDVLVIGWGSTYGVIASVVHSLHQKGIAVGHTHLRYIRPFAEGLEEICKRFKRVIVPELNNGQLVRILRDQFLIDAKSLSKVQGMPFSEAEIKEAIIAQLD